MASRQEEKEARRKERLAKEEAERSSHARQRRLQLALGGLLALAAIIGVVVAISSSGGDDGGTKDSTSSNTKTVALPELKDADLTSSAKAAGCTVKTYPDYGSGHVTTKVTYKTNPPTSGNHNPTPASDGEYDAGNEPPVEKLVHALEHGRIEYQYKPGTPAADVDKLRSIYLEKVRGVSAYHSLLFQNNTKMPYAVAATAWTHSLTCDEFSDKTIDALRNFRTTYVDKAPEFIPGTE